MTPHLFLQDEVKKISALQVNIFDHVQDYVADIKKDITTIQRLVKLHQTFNTPEIQTLMERVKVKINTLAKIKHSLASDEAPDPSTLMGETDHLTWQLADFEGGNILRLTFKQSHTEEEQVQYVKDEIFGKANMFPRRKITHLSDKFAFVTYKPNELEESWKNLERHLRRNGHE